MFDYASYKVSKAEKLRLYESMLYPRMIEEKMLLLLRQGKISKWFSGIGQEAISVGTTLAVQPEEFLFPMHRNLGVFTCRQIPLHKLYCQWQGKEGSFTKGRDRSFHFGSKAHHVVGMISHLGPQLSLAGGVALACKLANEKAISVAFTGEGGTSEGEFHEALNVAAVWQLPVIFIIENNGYGLSTPVIEQYKCEHLSDRGIGYGMNAKRIDGNNILEVYDTIKTIAKDIRKKPEPWLIECDTFRMRGHEEASGTKYVPNHLMEYWAERDPITNFETHLLKEKVLTKKKIENIKVRLAETIISELAVAGQSAEIQSTASEELQDVYAPAEYAEIPADQQSEVVRFIDGISQSLDQSMSAYDNLIIMGQDVADYGGVFKITDGFAEKYGKARVRNTPLCESAIIGAGIGLSLKGFKSVVEMQFADFVTCGFNQIVNNAAKLKYRWNENVDMVIRMPCGGSVGAGPFHSQSNEAWFTHVPGLKIVYPSNPEDAKGLLNAAIDDPNTVLYFEHKALYRSLKEEVPVNRYHTPIGKAKTVRSGDTLSIITYGLGVHWAKSLVDEMNEDFDIVDVRSLVPLDYDAIDETVKKTNKVIVLHEDTLFGGIGGEISAYISEHLFEYLDGPVMRVGSLDTPIPFNKELEKQFLGNSRLKETAEKLLRY